MFLLLPYLNYQLITMEYNKSSPNSQVWMKKLILMTTGSVALVGLLLGVGIWRTGTRFIAGFDVIFNSPPPEVTLPTSIVSQIKEAKELTTAVFVTNSVIPTSQELKLGQFVVAETNLLYVAYGEVRAGVDLNSLSEENVQVENNSVVIKLPPPIIIDRKIDVNRSGVYYYDRGFLGLGPDVAPQLQTLAQRESLQQIVTTACNEGLLAEANERGKEAIAQLLNTAGYAVEVQTSPVDYQVCLRTNR